MAFSRCLVELGLASNAPTQLKTQVPPYCISHPHSIDVFLLIAQALRLLPPNLIVPLPSLVVTPYMPVPETNGEEWDRLEPASALDALVELALHGEYNGLFGEKRSREGLELRGAALGVFQVHMLRLFIRASVDSTHNTFLELCSERREIGRAHV